MEERIEFYICPRNVKVVFTRVPLPTALALNLNMTNSVTPAKRWKGYFSEWND